MEAPRTTFPWPSSACTTSRSESPTATVRTAGLMLRRLTTCWPACARAVVEARSSRINDHLLHDVNVRLAAMGASWVGRELVSTHRMSLAPIARHYGRDGMKPSRVYREPVLYRRRLMEQHPGCPVSVPQHGEAVRKWGL